MFFGASFHSFEQIIEAGVDLVCVAHYLAHIKIWHLCVREKSVKKLKTQEEKYVNLKWSRVISEELAKTLFQEAECVNY